LYLLLRATGLGVAEGHGKASGTLTLDASMHRQWLELNPTERYFNLLEAWLRRGAWETSGLRGGGWVNRVAADARDVWKLIPAAGRTFSRKSEKRGEFLHSAERSCTLALLELFGLMTVGRGEPDEGQGWRVTNVRHTPFGDALLEIAFEEIGRELFAREQLAAEFGVWQPALRPFFPEWVNNLEFPEPEARGGVFHFKVSLGEPWRRIAIPGKSDLDELADCIIGAFDFDGDHLYAFDFVARDGRWVCVEHPCVDDAETHTDEMTVGELPLTERQSMKFQYDFGAAWRFDVRLEKIEPESADVGEAVVVESHGEAPPEYEFDEEW
jgi:hypothetical protein